MALHRASTLAKRLFVWEKEVEADVHDEDEIDDLVYNEEALDLCVAPHHADLVWRDSGREEERRQRAEVPSLHQRRRGIVIMAQVRSHAVAVAA